MAADVFLAVACGIGGGIGGFVGGQIAWRYRRREVARLVDERMDAWFAERVRRRAED